ncbi:MAG: phosphoglucosamine mutase [Pseudomonadota bacterium]
MARQIFGTDGIRGVANTFPITAEVALNVGRAVAYLFRRNTHRPKIIIGKDTRISGYMLEEAMVSGICSMGGDAYLIGPIPTPGVSFMVQSQRADAGIVISASHNPFEDNGIKIFSSNGFKLPDEKEHEIENIILNNVLAECLPDPKNLGRAYRIEDAEGRYIVFLKNTFPRELSMEGIKIVLDCANGATYKVAPHVFWELGADVHTIHAAPDGFNINHQCGSQHTRDLSAAVIKEGAQIGMAFDGDGDRLIAVDEKGHQITGDQIIAICANTLQKDGRLKAPVVVTTVMSNKGLDQTFKKMGIEHVKAQVGDRYVLEEMLRTGSVLGGEDSGHVIFLDHHTAGDGIISGLQLLAAMLKEQKPLSELSKIVTIFPQMLLNVEVKAMPDLRSVPAVQKVIAAVEQELGENGRVLVRYSGTQQICRVMVEAQDKDKTGQYCQRIAEVIRQCLG